MSKTVASQSIAVAKAAESWPMLASLMGGTGAMRKAAKLFLPAWPAEDEDAYKERLRTSVLHPVFSKTVRVMAAKPFVQDAVIEPSLPAELTELEEDCDRQGSGLNEFFADRFIECLAYGLTGVLVDYSGEGGRTVADDKKAGARPYFCAYPCQSILGWRVGADGKLSQLRLIENIVEDEGDFGEKAVQQVRVLTVGNWATYRKNDKDEWVIHKEGTTNLDCIPFVFFYGIKQGLGLGETPLLDLAYQNVEHWQSSSDQQCILHIARVPILFARGFGETAIKIGAGLAVKSDDQNADLKWVEHTGAAIAAGADSIQALEDRMLQAGAELLIKRAGSTTATQVISENEANRSTLENLVDEFESSAETCLMLAAKWRGATYTPEVEFFKDFAVGASDSDMTMILTAHKDGVLTPERVKSEMIRRNTLAPDSADDATPTVPKSD